LLSSAFLFLSPLLLLLCVFSLPFLVLFLLPLPPLLLLLLLSPPSLLFLCFLLGSSQASLCLSLLLLPFSGPLLLQEPPLPCPFFFPLLPLLFLPLLLSLLLL